MPYILHIDGVEYSFDEFADARKAYMIMDNALNVFSMWITQDGWECKLDHDDYFHKDGTAKAA